jgi:hypothetical protein
MSQELDYSIREPLVTCSQLNLNKFVWNKITSSATGTPSWMLSDHMRVVVTTLCCVLWSCQVNKCVLSTTWHRAFPRWRKFLLNSPAWGNLSVVPWLTSWVLEICTFQDCSLSHLQTQAIPSVLFSHLYCWIPGRPSRTEDRSIRDLTPSLGIPIPSHTVLGGTGWETRVLPPCGVDAVLGGSDLWIKHTFTTNLSTLKARALEIAQGQKTQVGAGRNQFLKEKLVRSLKQGQDSVLSNQENVDPELQSFISAPTCLWLLACYWPEQWPLSCPICHQGWTASLIPKMRFQGCWCVPFWRLLKWSNPEIQGRFVSSTEVVCSVETPHENITWRQTHTHHSSPF